MVIKKRGDNYLGQNKWSNQMYRTISFETYKLTKSDCNLD